MKEYKERFNRMLERDGTSPNDWERKSMFYILCYNDDLFSKIHHIYDFNEHMIKPECLDSGEVDFSGSSKKLIGLAFNLYNGYPADISDTFSLLDEDNAQMADNAIRIRFDI